MRRDCSRLFTLFFNVNPPGSDPEAGRFDRSQSDRMSSADSSSPLYTVHTVRDALLRRDF